MTLGIDFGDLVGNRISLEIGSPWRSSRRPTVGASGMISLTGAGWNLHAPFI